VPFGILLLFFSSKLLALDYYSYDFRDINGTTNFNLELEAHSDKLPFDIFDDAWINMPAHKKSNNAFGQIYSDIYVDYEGLKVGVFGERVAQININDGFVELWYEAQKDFTRLLASDRIYKTLEPKPIRGEGNSYESSGLFVQKVFPLATYHHLSTKLKVHYAKDLHYISVDGYTNKKKLVGSFDYIYSNKNLITKGTDNSDSPLGVGYALDIEYIYNREKFYMYLGGFNIGSYIYWKNITRMHYDFDSEVIYKGDDGYNHYKPFGRGHYEYNKSFIQKIPTYYKASLNYALLDNFAVGNNVQVYENMYSYEPYINAKIYSNRYKIGIETQSKTLMFGVYLKHIQLELANKFGLDGNILSGRCKISF